MTTDDDTHARLIEIAESVCEGAGYELVDLHYQRGPQGWVVRVYIDNPHGAARALNQAAISFSDCERLSRELSAVLDVEDPIPHSYSLEVSSPGFDRPLRTLDHFRRFLGEQARIALHRSVGGRRNFQGRLLAADEQEIEIEIDGTLHRLPRAEVSSARLVPDWDAKRGSFGTGTRRQGR
jgi:ribosome maturation factor RimP